MQTLMRTVFIVLLALAVSGCARSAAQMAATQPEAVDLSLLSKGTPRDKIVARLGAPQTTDQLGTFKDDVYKFRQGYSAMNRTARVFTHSTLSIATLGLWEVAGTAIEGYARGSMVSLRIIFDEFDHLESYEIIDGADALDGEVVENAMKRPGEETKPEQPKPAFTTATLISQ